MYKINTHTQYKWCKKLRRNPDWRVVMTNYVCIYVLLLNLTNLLLFSILHNWNSTVLGGCCTFSLFIKCKIFLSIRTKDCFKNFLEFYRRKQNKLYFYIFFFFISIIVVWKEIKRRKNKKTHDNFTLKK